MTAFSIIASPLTYIITHTIFDFGIVGTSLSAFPIAFILGGLLGYTA